MSYGMENLLDFLLRYTIKSYCGLYIEHKIHVQVLLFMQQEKSEGRNHAHADKPGFIATNKC
jgi:hypothetical protein